MDERLHGNFAGACVQPDSVYQDPCVIPTQDSPIAARPACAPGCFSCLLGRTLWQSLERIFPCGLDMALIVDDRDDVWRGAQANNLLLVRPYKFFVVRKTRCVSGRWYFATRLVGDLMGVRSQVYSCIVCKQYQNKK